MCLAKALECASGEAAAIREPGRRPSTPQVYYHTGSVTGNHNPDLLMKLGFVLAILIFVHLVATRGAAVLEASAAR